MSTPAPDNSTTRTLTGLAPGRLYRFRVRARNEVGFGPYSQWSQPGTPLDGTDPPPPPPVPDVAMSVSIKSVAFSRPSIVPAPPGDHRDARPIAVGTAVAEATLIGDGEGGDTGGAVAGAVTYTWQGRYLRTYNTPTSRFHAVVGEWQNVTLRSNATPDNLSRPSGYYLIPQPLLDVDKRSELQLRIYVPYMTPQNPPSLPALDGTWWQLRCVANCSYVRDGQTGLAFGISRVIAFKEMWLGIDYPTLLVD